VLPHYLVKNNAVEKA